VSCHLDLYRATSDCPPSIRAREELPDRNLEGSDRGRRMAATAALSPLSRTRQAAASVADAVKNSYVKAVISYEPVRFLFPEGELPPAQPGALFPRCRSRWRIL